MSRRSALTPQSAPLMVGRTVRLAPGMATALGLLAYGVSERAIAIICNVTWALGWPQFTLGFDSVRYEPALEFEFQSL